MEKVNSPLIVLLSRAAVAGNILFILWISYNAIDDGFKGTVYQKISYVTLTGLLLTNIFLILRRRVKSNKFLY